MGCQSQQEAWRRGGRGRPALSPALSAPHRVGVVSSADREAALWEMEEHQLQERHQLVKQQLKDQYFLQRHELLRKHEKVRLGWDAGQLDGGTQEGLLPPRGGPETFRAPCLRDRNQGKFEGHGWCRQLHCLPQHLRAWLSRFKASLAYLNCAPPPKEKKERKEKEVILLDLLGVSVPNTIPKLKITIQMPLSQPPALWAS